MESLEGFQASAAIIILGGGMLWNTIRNKKKVRLIQDTPRSKIVSAPQGFVEVEGFAWPISQGPLSAEGFECVYYSMRIERQESRGSGKNRRTVWVPVYTFSYAEPFYVVDPTGLAIVDSSACELDVGSSRVNRWSSLSEPRKNYLQAKIIKKEIPGFPPRSGFFGFLSSTFRVVEKEFFVGSPIHVSGDFRSDEMSSDKIREGGLSAFCKRVFNLEARSLKNVSHILDSDKNGEVSEVEARKGYALSAKACRASAKLSPDTEQEFLICGSFKKSESHPLQLSDVHEAHLVQRLGRFSNLKVVAGILLLTFGIGSGIFQLIDVFPGTAVYSRERVSTQASSVGSIDAHKLHSECLTTLASSCAELLKYKSELSLSRDQINYYSSQACKGGRTSFCK